MRDPRVQTPFDVAVLMTTVVRPTIQQALRSVYAQTLPGRIQVMVGIDKGTARLALLQAAIAEAPAHVVVTVIDLGYSTSRVHGGLYPSRYGGAMKTILSYAANSRYVTFLDDDNWYEPTHFASLRRAVEGRDWAFALRRFVDAASGDALGPDNFESLGPGKGIYAQTEGGFVDANCYMIDKLACYDVFGEWAMTRYPGGTGGDRQVHARLRSRPFGATGEYSVNYRLALDQVGFYRLWKLRKNGVDLAKYLPPEAIPDAATWPKCEEMERAETIFGATQFDVKLTHSIGRVQSP
jgi:hypothetical protein